MPDERYPHLWIPTDRVSNSRFAPSGFPPTYQRTDYTEHGERLLRNYHEVLETLAQRDDSALTEEVILQLVTPEAIPIRTQGQRLENLGFNLVGYSSRHSNRGTGLISRLDLGRLERRLVEYTRRPEHPGRTNIAVLESLGEVPADEKVDPTLLSGDVHERGNCMIALYSRLARPEKLAVAEAIASRLQTSISEGVRVREYVNGTVVVTAPLSPEEMLAIGTRYISVRSIVPNDEIVTTRAVAVSPLPTTISVAAPAIRRPVAVFDSGINDSGQLLKGIVSRRLAFLPIGAVGPHNSHGTFVASRVVFGDDLDRQLLAPPLRPVCPLVDIPVIGVGASGRVVSPREADLIAAIQSAVPQLAPEVRVFNLSVGPPARVATGAFSEMAKVLDYLARAHDVLFVIAAGNIKNPVSVPPTHFAHESARMEAPADALLALTVGSYAKYSDHGALAKPREVSPFSRRGPGSDSGTKPEVVAHGGNLLDGWRPGQRIATYGLFEDGAQLAVDVGTSFAAPLVSQLAVRLFDNYPHASTNLVRALLCHFCESIDVPPGTGCDPLHLRGFGEPVVEKALFANERAAAFLYQGSVRSGSVQHITFYVPSTLKAGRGRGSLRIRGTLVYDPPVNPDNSIEYSKTRIVVQLWKRVEVGFRRVQLAAGDDDVGRPWNPVVHFDMPFTSGFETGDWEIRLRLMTRGHVPDDFEQGYAIVIEVIDGLGKEDVRKNVVEETGSSFSLPTVRVAA